MSAERVGQARDDRVEGVLDRAHGVLEHVADLLAGTGIRLGLGLWLGLGGGLGSSAPAARRRAGTPATAWGRLRPAAASRGSGSRSGLGRITAAHRGRGATCGCGRTATGRSA
ncbi:hypothetical protein, partial [Blastococcus sp. CT_GayMR20]|uniref:hypothetical protein n=1 Tax=Blastococcus sp. CT_GayMR20 TaxID=2559609 RepID=UPI001ADDBD61